MKRGVVVFLIACCLILQACGGPGSTGSGDRSEPFIGGNGGIAVSFQEGMPPAEILDKGMSGFSLGVKLENVGEADAGTIEGSLDPDNPFVGVKIVGIDHYQFFDPNFGYPIRLISTNISKHGEPNGTEEDGVLEQTISLQGARKNFDGTVIPGTLQLLTFGNYYFLQNMVGNDQITFRAELCYDYSTHVTTKVCIKEDFDEDILDDTICTLTGPKQPKNSGAPVHVTSLTQNPTTELIEIDSSDGDGVERIERNGIRFNFVVENVGTGSIFSRNPNPSRGGLACDFGYRNKNRNMVNITVTRGNDPDGSDIRCNQFGEKNHGVVFMGLEGEPRSVSCVAMLEPGDDIYTDFLDIVLQYRYGEFVEVPVTIRDVTPGERGGLPS